MTTDVLDVLGGRAAWLGTDLQHSSEWKVELDDAQRAELLVALAHAEPIVADRGLAALRRDDFPLPTLGAVVASVVDELVDGRGFVLLRGLPVAGLSEHQAEILSWGLCRYIGIGIRQGPGGDLVMHVRDHGVDPSHPLARGYQLTTHLDYHTDSPDVVGLVCLRPAKRGGVSTIISSVAVHDALVAERPDVVATLAGTWWHDRRTGDGPESFFTCPIYAINQHGRLFAYYGPDYVRSAPRGSGVPELSAAQLEALDVLEAMNNQARFVLNMDFQSGDLQLLNNYVVMHARTAYEDHPEPARKRDLIRLWLTIDRDLDLPASTADRGITLRHVAFQP